MNLYSNFIEKRNSGDYEGEDELEMNEEEEADETLLSEVYTN